MKIIEPKVELWKQGNDAKAHVAKCARVCYGKETGNDEATVKRLIDSRHWSMFRHESVYAIIYSERDGLISYIFSNYANCPYINTMLEDKTMFISTNGHFMLDLKDKDIDIYTIISDNIVSEEEFCKNEYAKQHLCRITFCIDTQISTSRELNRVSPNNIAEKSTRYVYEDGSICRPYWLNKELIKQYEEESIIDIVSTVYLDSCSDSFKRYKFLIENCVHRQDARGVLPLDTATRCIYTYSIDEWFDIIRKRVYNTTGKAHPNATIICKLIEQELNRLGYEVKI